MSDIQPYKEECRSHRNYCACQLINFKIVLTNLAFLGIFQTPSWQGL
jgi:hypothetical protein